MEGPADLHGSRSPASGPTVSPGGGPVGQPLERPLSGHEGPAPTGAGPTSERGHGPRTAGRAGGKARVRTFSATDRDIDMLSAIAEYHGFSRSAMITSLIRKEFWRIFPSGTDEIRPDRGARVEEG